MLHRCHTFVYVDVYEEVATRLLTCESTELGTRWVEVVGQPVSRLKEEAVAAAALRSCSER